MERAGRLVAGARWAGARWRGAATVLLAFAFAPTASMWMHAGPAAAEEAQVEATGEWEQEAVVDLASRADVAVDALLADPGLREHQATAIQQRDHDAAVSSTRELSGRLKTLRERLEAGYDRDSSEPFWYPISLVRGEILDYARHSWLPPATQRKAETAGKLLDELALLYR